MAEVRITLSGLWVATMLTYLLGDVLRIFAGDFVAGEIDGRACRLGERICWRQRSWRSRSSWSCCP